MESTEGLLVYLPDVAQDALFDNIAALSVPAVGWLLRSCPPLLSFMNER